MVVETQTFKQNAVEVTKPSLSSAFSNMAELEAELEKVALPTLSDMFKTAGGNENVRQLALQSGSVDGVQKNGASLTKHYNEMRARGAKQGGGKSDLALYVLLDQLQTLEGQLADQYGENFAEDLLSDLVEDGKVSQDEYDRIMGIEDPDERRQAIAALIQSKLDSGELTLADLEGHPWAEEWLGLHQEAVAQSKLEADQYEAGQKSGSELSKDGADQAAATQNSEAVNELSEFDKAKVSNEVSDSSVELTGFFK